MGKTSVTVHSTRACGGIGRRARLRIWCLATCRFESYQAHEDDCQVVDIQPLGILFCVVWRGFDVLLCIVCAGLSGVLERFALRIIKFLFFHFLYIAIS